MLFVGQRRPAPRARRRLSSTPPFPADPACGQATLTTFIVRTDAGASQSGLPGDVHVISGKTRDHTCGNKIRIRNT